MASKTAITVRLSAETKAKLDRLAESVRRSHSSLAAEALAAYVDREFESIAGIERGLDDVRNGRVVSHEEAMEQIRAAIAKHA